MPSQIANKKSGARSRAGLREHIMTVEQLGEMSERVPRRRRKQNADEDAERETPKRGAEG